MCPNCGIALSKFEAFEFGNVEIYFKGKAVVLTPVQRMITEALIRAKGRPMERYTLLEVVGSSNDSERSIDVYVRRIRRAFQEIDPSFNQLATVRQFGYRWDFVPKKADLRLVA
jgi:DNA-binding response OmpR family regulator